MRKAGIIITCISLIGFVVDIGITLIWGFGNPLERSLPTILVRLSIVLFFTFLLGACMYLYTHRKEIITELKRLYNE